MANGNLKDVTRRLHRQVAINTLSDDALLYVFDFYVAQASEVEAWHTLVQVCRRWRSLVFESPRRLNLRIGIEDGDLYENRIREKPDIWPALPIVISGYCDSKTYCDNIKAILHKHRDRVCGIELGLTSEEEEEEIFAALEEPFPALTALKLYSAEGGPAETDIFSNPNQILGGSTTHLRSLSLTGISISDLLPKLLLSSTDLVDLRLKEIIISIFVPPVEMVAILSALTRLQVLHLGPEFDDEFHTNWEARRLPLAKRTVLPSLIELKFKGVIGYLDDFMGRIDAPLLDRLDIVVIIFTGEEGRVLNAPQVLWFISHVPKFQALGEAHIRIDSDNHNIWIKFLSTRTSSSDVLKLEIDCIQPGMLLHQFFRSPFFPLPALESLYIDGSTTPTWRADSANDAQWPELLRPFTSVKNLYLREDFAPRITSALEEPCGEIVTDSEVLPALESLFLEEVQPSDPAQAYIGKFVAVRALSGHPIAISRWDGSLPARFGEVLGDE